MKEKNIIPDIGLPSLFYKKRNEEDNEDPMLLNSHVDDRQMLGREEDQEKLIEFLQKEKGWKLNVEGPVYPTEGECNCLKRVFAADSEGIHVKPNVKYGEKLADILDLKAVKEPARGSTPFPVDSGASWPQGKAIGPEDHSRYRSGVGILMCLSQDRPEIAFACKRLSAKPSCPDERDLKLLRHTAKFVIHNAEAHVLHKPTYPGCSFLARDQKPRNHDAKDIYPKPSLLQVCSDSDSASCRTTRQSNSCAAIFLNGNLVNLFILQQDVRKQ